MNVVWVTKWHVQKTIVTSLLREFKLVEYIDKSTINPCPTAKKYPIAGVHSITW